MASKMICATCAKRGDPAKYRLRSQGCIILKERYANKCPFWSDDPEWQDKAEQAIRAYAATSPIGG